MPSYDSLKKKQTELIRKAVDGSVFVAPITAPLITTLTESTGVAPNNVIDLKALPTGYADAGYMTDDGVSFARDVSTSDITSWGSLTPTRTDITADSSTISFTGQETNIQTIGLGTGRDMSTVSPAATTSEVDMRKPLAPSKRAYRVLALAVDRAPEGDIYIARFFPRAQVSSFSDQSFNGGDSAIEWGVTMAGFVDTTAGYSERWLFGGAGWRALLVQMGFPAAT